MKFLTTLLLAVLVALGAYAARRRIRFALTAGAIVYLIILPLRLLLAVGDVADRFDTFAWPLLVLFLAWLVLWQVSTRYERRKLAERRAHPRPPWWRRR